MPRHKKDKNKKKDEALQDLQQDHEQFLQTFEKPTQIYRFLRARHLISPVFMHRTLLYMRDRCSRTNARRKEFSLKDLLNLALSDENSVQQVNTAKTEDLLLAISGVCMNFPSENDNYKIEIKKYKRLDVEVFLSKTILNKRKDTDFLPKEVSEGIVEVPVNPRVSNQNKPFDENEGVISISSTSFVSTTSDGSAVRSCSVIFRIREASSNSDSEESESEESESDSSSEEETGRQRKRKKTSKENEDDPAGISLKNLTSGPRRRRVRASVKKVSERRKDAKSDEEEESSNKAEKQKTYHRSSNKPAVLKTNPVTSKPVIFETELLVFNSDHERLVQDGEYELAITKKESDAPEEYKRKAVWESFDGGREIKVYSAFSGPTIKLQLRWNSSDDPGPLADCSDEESNDSFTLETGRRRTRTAQLQEKNNISENSAFKMKVDHVEYRKFAIPSLCKNSLSNGNGQNGVTGKVFYQFMYNNNTQQQTESRDDFYCPWCQLNCMTLYGLMKHLKLCHPRFLFNYSQQPKGTIIIVTVNECYDGSYTGNPQNIFSQPGFAFSRRGPVRRIPVTEILVYKPQRNRDQNLSLAELLDKEDAEALETAQFSTGHRRLYFHSLTTLPIRPCEFDLDSDGEGEEPDWLFGHTKRMIDEFTDVNEGEKALMKIWNLHVMRHACIADCQIEKECERFIDKNIELLCHHGLRRNLLLHFICLVDFGVFKTSSVLTLMDYYDKVNAEYKKNSPPKGGIPDMMSKDFPEPDLLPRIDQLTEIVKEA